MKHILRWGSYHIVKYSIISNYFSNDQRNLILGKGGWQILLALNQDFGGNILGAGKGMEEGLKIIWNSEVLGLTQETLNAEGMLSSEIPVILHNRGQQTMAGVTKQSVVCFYK